MKIKIWSLITCVPGEGRPCIPEVFASEAAAEAAADAALREAWKYHAPEDWEKSQAMEYPGDWRKANDILIQSREHSEEPWGQYDIIVGEIDLPIAGEMLAFAQQMARFTTPEDEFADDPQGFADVEEMISEMGDERLCGEYSTFMEMVRSARKLVAKVEGR